VGEPNERCPSHFITATIVLIWIYRNSSPFASSLLKEAYVDSAVLAALSLASKFRFLVKPGPPESAAARWPRSGREIERVSVLTSARVGFTSLLCGAIAGYVANDISASRAAALRHPAPCCPTSGSRPTSSVVRTISE
jgi:hypothetical protein